MRNLPGAGADARPDLSHVDTWIFDLDNTLYPAECQLFAQIDRRMTAFMEARLGLAPDEARRRQKQFYADYGTTLSGLMIEHGVAPGDFLGYVHDIDVTAVPANPELAERIANLPGRRLVFTNGSVAHAENVMNQLGVAALFDDIFDIAAAGFTPKPKRAAYDLFVNRYGVAPARAAMFEDLAQNLAEPHALGMTTVLVCSQAEWLNDEPAGKRPARPGDVHEHVHHVTDDLTTFLGRAVILAASSDPQTRSEK